jgi:hypothetical protein
MSPTERIRDLCQRYNVSQAFGDRMLSFAERAQVVEPELRDRLHAFLERSFVAQAQVEQEEAKADRAVKWTAASPAEERLVCTVAGVLHGWQPPRWLDRWASIHRPC